MTNARTPFISGVLSVAPIGDRRSPSILRGRFATYTAKFDRFGGSGPKKGAELRLAGALPQTPGFSKASLWRSMTSDTAVLPKPFNSSKKTSRLREIIYGNILP